MNRLGLKCILIFVLFFFLVKNIFGQNSIRYASAIDFVENSTIKNKIISHFYLKKAKGKSICYSSIIQPSMTFKDIKRSNYIDDSKFKQKVLAIDEQSIEKYLKEDSSVFYSVKPCMSSKKEEIICYISLPLKDIIVLEFFVIKRYNKNQTLVMRLEKSVKLFLLFNDENVIVGNDIFLLKPSW